MTKPQIWIASFLVLFILLFILERVTKEEEKFMPIPTENLTNQPSNTNLSAQDLITMFGCTNCHGVGLEGTKQGPALKDISKNFGRGELIGYLRNPASFMGSERFQKYREQYPGVIMPNFGNRDVKDLGKIADYLLRR
ncbi:MAG: c-type cytochrome [Ignavibacteria bacterium]|nr:c-type cytochrome [Ignavibacteria bacterium]